MKNHLSIPRIKTVLILVALATTAPLRAEQSSLPTNAYDLLGRVLSPMASVFSPASDVHGLSAVLSLEEMTDLPPALAGAHAELALQPPDRFLIRAPFLSATATVCRAGQQIWITPGSKLETLLNPTGKMPKVSKNKADAFLPGLELPFTPEQLALLPMFFQVTGDSTQNGLRILEVRLTPVLAKNQEIEAWSARLSINPELKLTRIELMRPGFHLKVRVERLEYAPELPAATWEPDSTDVVRLDARQANAWLTGMGHRLNSPQKNGAQ